MSDIKRFFKSDERAVVVAREALPSGAVLAANTFVLSDPKDLTSDPTSGWVEINEGQYEAECSKAIVMAEKSRKDNAKAEQKAFKKAYEEALALGFSLASATAITGYSPPG